MAENDAIYLENGDAEHADYQTIDDCDLPDHVADCLRSIVDQGKFVIIACSLASID